MTLVPKMWTFEKLPEKTVKTLLSVHLLGNAEDYRDSRNKSSILTGTLFDSLAHEEVIPEIIESNVIWGADDYEILGDDYSSSEPLHDLRVVKLRVEKNKSEQQRRVKQKAEVFTPSWVCNLQNNLIDDAVLGDNSFNTVSEDQKTWVSSYRVPFTEEYPWWKYVSERRLEMCCGEAPYLFSSYDATTGEYLPVRSEDSDGILRWRRIGLLDRKLRVLSENISKEDEWVEAAKIALKSTYGYEWQGDNLALARLNMVNTYFDHYRDFMLNTLGKSESTVRRHMTASNLQEVAEIVSWQLWQMDGLKQVFPMSCSSKCEACEKKERVRHDGLLPVVRWGDSLKPFEDFLLDNAE